MYIHVVISSLAITRGHNESSECARVVWSITIFVCNLVYIQVVSYPGIYSALFMRNRCVSKEKKKLGISYSSRHVILNQVFACLWIPNKPCRTLAPRVLAKGAFCRIRPTLMQQSGGAPLRLAVALRGLDIEPLEIALYTYKSTWRPVKGRPPSLLL